MAFDEKLAERVRELLADQRQIAEKHMMGGLTFMVNNKMCLGIVKDDLMARIDPDVYETALDLPGCRPMDFTGKPMKGYVFIGSVGTLRQKDLKYWVELALEFNSRAKESKKRKRKR